MSDDQKNYSNVIYLNNNIKTAIYTCKALNLNNVNNDKILAGISNIKKNSQLIGRWTTVSNNPKIIFDAAHNLAGFESISSQLLKTKYNQLHVILAFIKGKNINELISTLPSNSNIYLNDKSHLLNLNILNFASNSKYSFKNFSEAMKNILKSKTHKFDIDGKYLMNMPKNAF